MFGKAVPSKHLNAFGSGDSAARSSKLSKKLDVDLSALDDRFPTFAKAPPALFKFVRKDSPPVSMEFRIAPTEDAGATTR
jgi:hypothetical protein